MPLILHHGPPSTGKTAALLELLAPLVAGRGGDPQILVLTASKGRVTLIKTLLAQRLPNLLLMGETILTLDDFFLKLMKRQWHRAHLADDFTCTVLAYLVTLDLRRNLNCAMDPAGLKGMTRFFMRLKTCGLDPAGARRYFTDRLEEPALLDAFDGYQRELRARHYGDAGDLYLAAIKGLRTGAVSQDMLPSHLVLTGIYPLHAGHREILRLIREKHPRTRVDVFYDEDHTRTAEDLMTRAYEELGALADDAVHYPAPPVSAFPVAVFASPAEEAVAVARQAHHAIDNGATPFELLFAAPPEYHPLLTAALAGQGIAASSQAVMPLSGFMQNGAPDHPPWLELARAVRLQHAGAVVYARAVEAARKFKERAAFLDSLFADLIAKAPAAEYRAFLNRLARAETFTARPSSFCATLVQLTALGLNSRAPTAILGLTAENLIRPAWQGTIPPELYARPELAELLDAPGYRERILKERLRQELEGSPPPGLSRSKIDARGRPVRPVALAGVEWIDADPQIYDAPAEIHDAAMTQPCASKYPPTSARQPIGTWAQSPFPTSTHQHSGTSAQSFSITALQTYIDCPYKYYAGRLLKLGTVAKDDIEPPADARGNFVHAIVNNLFNQQSDLYLAALRGEVPAAELATAVGRIAKDLLRDNEGMNRFPRAVVDAFMERAVTAIITCLTTEADWRSAAKKITIPAASEWKIGDASSHGLTVATTAGSVTLTGRIDRVDVSADGRWVSVVDFKTGALFTTPEIRRGENIQIPLYLMAATEFFAPGALATAGFLYGLKDADAGGIARKDTPDALALHHSRRLDETAWEDMRSNVIAKIGVAAAGIRAGKFSPRPRVASLCRTCDYRRLCGYAGEVGGDATD